MNARRRKMHGFVESVEADAFWVRLWYADGTTDEYEARFDNSQWPASVDYPAPREGVFLSIPKRRDASLVQVKLPPFTRRDLLKAQQEARQMVKRFAEIGAASPTTEAGEKWMRA